MIVQDGLRRMYAEQENVFYYITLMNENYAQPAHAGGRGGGHPAGACTCCAQRRPRQGARAAARRRHDPARGARAPPSCCETDFGVPADVWSVTSFNELRREALDAERWNLLHPGRGAAHAATCEQLLAGSRGPVVAATDYMRTVPDQIRPWVPGRYHVLGTDGYGRSDTRAALRDFFEVDRRYVALAALKALADEGHARPGDGRERHRSASASIPTSRTR